MKELFQNKGPAAPCLGAPGRQHGAARRLRAPAARVHRTAAEQRRAGPEPAALRPRPDDGATPCQPPCEASRRVPPQFLYAVAQLNTYTHIYVCITYTNIPTTWRGKLLPGEIIFEENYVQFLGQCSPIGLGQHNFSCPFFP